jgi:hypothetical protein
LAPSLELSVSERASVRGREFLLLGHRLLVAHTGAPNQAREKGGSRTANSKQRNSEYCCFALSVDDPNHTLKCSWRV